MITQNEIKLIQSLQQKKFRQKYNLFVAEGKKLVQEFVKSDFKIQKIYATTSFDFLSEVDSSKLEIVNEAQLKKISSLTNHQEIVCVLCIPENNSVLHHVDTIVLENLQDPGNVGTIIRLADWFGISQIICSENTVDVYNPKVVQATMGSLSRITVLYQNIPDFIKEYKGMILAADMQGESIYQTAINEPFALIMANEGNGISDELLALSTHKISIPKFGNSEVESLNVAMSTGIILSEIIGKKQRI